MLGCRGLIIYVQRNGKCGTKGVDYLCKKKWKMWNNICSCEASFSRILILKVCQLSANVTDDKNHIYFENEFFRKRFFAQKKCILQFLLILCKKNHYIRCGTMFNFTSGQFLLQFMCVKKNFQIQFSRKRRFP